VSFSGPGDCVAGLLNAAHDGGESASFPDEFEKLNLLHGGLATARLHLKSNEPADGCEDADEIGAATTEAVSDVTGAVAELVLGHAGLIAEQGQAGLGSEVEADRVLEFRFRSMWLRVKRIDHNAAFLRSR
jgi:hypothetical protein